MKPIKKSITYGRHQLTLETGEIARQAHGAVMVTMDDTVVLVTVVGAKNIKPCLLYTSGSRHMKKLR